jgi:uncharacterized protein (TIGR00369 family)
MIHQAVMFQDGSNGMGKYFNSVIRIDRKFYKLNYQLKNHFSIVNPTMKNTESPKSSLNRTVAKLSRVRPWLRWWALSWAFGRTVRFVRTSGVRFEYLSEERALLHIPNRKAVQNHIGSVHATAIALLAETASGAVLGMNVPEDRVPLLKSMRVEYFKRAKGDLRAEATLDAAARARILREEKGEIEVPVRVTDESGAQPVQCQMLWAWVPKHRK